MSLFVLATVFCIVALAYAAVGFGGGSSYNALLVLSGTDYQLIPAIALTCNILVVSGGVYHYRDKGFFQWRHLVPYVALSIPMAWLGGRLPVSEVTFTVLLGLTLLASGLQMFMQSPGPLQRPPMAAGAHWLWALPAGAAIGFLSGLVGVGGGVFLAPLLYLSEREPPRRIAGLASGFILVNSVSGLLGQLGKHSASSAIGDWAGFWPLFLAVLVGGQIGSRLGAQWLPENWLRRLTGVLVLYVAMRLLWRWYELVVV